MTITDRLHRIAFERVRPLPEEAGASRPGDDLVAAADVVMDRAFTLDAAYAEHAEQRLGSLEPGKWADFILIDRDLFTMPAADIWKVRGEQTWLAGQRVY